METIKAYVVLYAVSFTIGVVIAAGYYAGWSATESFINGWNSEKEAAV